jgi:signal transduction histidine kinase
MKQFFSRIHRLMDSLTLPGNGNRLQRYGFVIVLVIIFVLIKTTFSAFIGRDVPFLFGLFIVLISAWYGGFGPGMLATILTGFLNFYFFMEPKFTLFGEENIPNYIILGFFCAEGFIISVMSEAHRKSDIQKSEFVGVVSHELKNPLASIKGYAELLHKAEKRAGKKKLAEYASRIDLQVSNVLSMVNDMLDITKIETGRLTYHKEDFLINDLVKHIVADQQITTTTHTITLVGTSKKLIYGDRYRIGQVITNLLSNAIKYAPNSKKISVRIKDMQSGVQIAVADKGPGISKADQKRLFEPFYRSKSTDKATGTGIGLFISSQIIEQHKGKLSVKSTIGKGSTFTIFLKHKKPRSKNGA